MSEFTYEIDENYDYVLNEVGNVFIALRKISWNGREPKLDLRKYYNTKDGSERMDKGVSMSKECADELTRVLASTGYGNTRDIIDGIKDRDDFNTALSQSLKNEPKVLEELGIQDTDNFYDPREVFRGEDYE